MSGAQSRKNRPSRPNRLPDLMIGAVTLALLAGFGTLLLGERNKPVVAQTPPPAAIPASPGTVPEPQVDMPVTPDPAATQQTTPATGSAATDGNSGQTATTPSGSSASGVAQTQEIPPVPTAPPVEETKPQLPAATTPTQAQTPATTPTQTTPTQTTPAQTTPAPTPPAQATPAQATTPPAAGNPVATSANRVPLRSDYRISLGSFSTRKTVENQTGSVRGLGYTVHAIDLGDQYVAQIGPFADEASARRALADIQRAYPGALLYRPRNQTAETTTSSDTGSSAAGQATTPTTTSSSETTAQPVANTAPAPSGPTYLQVGAFDRAESAERLVGILKDNNFAPTVNSPEGRKTTVMVGPYSGDALIRAEARLDNAGLDHFRVR